MALIIAAATTGGTTTEIMDFSPIPPLSTTAIPSQKLTAMLVMVGTQLQRGWNAFTVDLSVEIGTNASTAGPGLQFVL